MSENLPYDKNVLNIKQIVFEKDLKNIGLGINV